MCDNMTYVKYEVHIFNLSFIECKNKFERLSSDNVYDNVMSVQKQHIMFDGGRTNVYKRIFWWALSCDRITQENN